MKKIYLHSLLALMGFLCVSMKMNAQGFNNTYGTADNNEFRSVVKLSGGDYIASGTTFTGASGDFYIARIDQSGNIVWQTTFGGSGNDIAYSSVLNTNGNVVVAGSSTSYSSNGTADVLLVEINPSGAIQWAKNYGNTSNLNEVPNKINLTAGGLGIAGTSTAPSSTTPDMLAFEVTNNGATINWQKTYSANGDLGYQLISSTASGYKYVLIGGSNATGTIGAYDQVVMKLDATGGVVSTKNLGSWDNENAHNVIELPGNELIIMGNVRALSGSGMDISLIKLSASNTIDWAKSYGDHSTGTERAYTLIPTAAGGYAMVGTTTAFGFGNNDGIIVTTDASGNMTGSKTYGGTGNDYPSDIVQNADGSFTFASFSASQGAGGNDAGLVRTLTDLTAPGNCSPSSVTSYPITPSSATMTMVATTNTLAVTNVTSTASAVSFTKNVVPAFTVSSPAGAQVCKSTSATFSISKPGVSMTWAHTGTATVQTNNATTYALTYANAGNYTVSGTYGSCSFSQPLSVTTTPVSFVGLNDSYLEGARSLNLSASPSGGTFKINGNTATVFQFHTAGTYNVQYTFVDANTCTNTTSKTVEVVTGPQADCAGVTLAFTGLNDFYCTGTAAFNLAATPSGGSFTINGTPATQFQCTVPGTYAVTYNYSGVGGCSETLTKNVKVASFSFVADDAVICPGQTVLFTASQCVAGTYNRYRYFVNGDPIGPFTSSNTVSIPNLVQGDAVHVYAYNNTPGNTNEITSDPVNIMYAATTPSVSINIPASNLFCNATDIDYPIVISSSVSGGVLSGTGVTESDFNPFGLTAGIYPLTYTVMVNGCTFVTTKNINVEQSPTVTLTSSDADNNICIGDNVIFTATTTTTRQLFLINSVGKQGPASNKTFPYSAFADGDVVSVIVDNGPNTCSVESSPITMNVGVKPIVGYEWQNICGGNREVQFTDFSTITAPSTITNWDWDVDGNGTFDYNYTSSNAPLHSYSTVNNFDAKLRVTTSEGCVVDLVKRVFSLDGIVVTKVNPYEVDFSVSDGGWDYDGQNPSWHYGTSPNFNSSGNNIWVTKNASDKHNVNEKSFLYSPCFNFTDLDKPSMHLSIFSKTNLNGGAILQVSVDGGQVWHTVGERGDGINWYDESANNGVDDLPGSNPAADAWTGTYSDWKLAKITLQNYAGLPAVRFRIGFGSSAASQTNPGFAIGRVKILNRTKVVLMEHFTGNNAVCGIPTNTLVEAVKDQRPKDVALVEYHTSIAGTPDIYHNYNPNDPGARVLYYGFGQGIVDVLDGVKTYGYDQANCYPTGNFSLDEVDRMTLEEPLFDLNVEAVRNSGVINISVDVEYNGTTDLVYANDNPMLQVVVIEHEASGDPNAKYVVRKMLPDAAGTPLRPVNNPATMPVGYTYHQNYGYYHVLPNNPKLDVVAFLQNHGGTSFRKVYQAFHAEGLIPTSTEEASYASAADFKIFPNPAQSEATVMFGKTINNKMNWQLIDALGQVVNEGTVESGTQGFSVDTASQTAGLYTLKVNQNEGEVITKKIVIAR